MVRGNLDIAMRYHVSMSSKSIIYLSLVMLWSLPRLQAIVQDLKNRLLSAAPVCLLLSWHISIDSPAPWRQS